jgi:hypothetical protein
MILNFECSILNGREEVICRAQVLSLFPAFDLQAPAMKPRNSTANASFRDGNPADSSIPFVRQSLSAIQGETTGRVLDLEVWDLESQGSYARNSLPKASLLPVTFSCPSRWGATHKR